MNHLRELLDTARNAMGFDPEFSEAQSAAMLAVTKAAGEQAQCFFMGDEESVCDLKPIPELLGGLPYPVTWFEWASKALPGVVSGVLAYAKDGRLNFICFARVDRQWGLMWFATADDLASGLCKVYSPDADARTGAQTAVFMIRAFCSAMNCTNVGRQENRPDLKLQKARAKRGKATLFSYWTLQLDGRSERGEDHGGTHAGPRVHLRRGHPRQYAAGKWTWVQAHAVGNKASGLVHKDYTAGPAMLVPAR